MARALPLAAHTTKHKALVFYYYLHVDNLELWIEQRHRHQEQEGV